MHPKQPRSWPRFFMASALGLFALAAPAALWAHCDTLGGPVIKAAEKALETKNLNLVLIWVQEKDEPEIRRAFEKTLAVRTLSPAAREMADLYFFETVVRVHRAGEGAAYTGLKPEGEGVSPAVTAADAGLETGSAELLLRMITHAVQENVAEHFRHLMARKMYKEGDVEAGREFVKAYVFFTHYVEGIYNAALKTAEAHAHAAAGEAHH